MAPSSHSDPVPAITEQSATGTTAEIFEDIRRTLDVEVVNLIWRHLATIPGSLEWVWTALKPLYQGAAIGPAVHIRSHLALPPMPAISRDALHAARIDDGALAASGKILDSYQHTNALALVCFSAFLARFDRTMPSPEPGPRPAESSTSYTAPGRAELPRLVPLVEMPVALANLVHELNGFGEDKDPALTASMYRHLAHWPVYLVVVRTMLAPLHESGELASLVAATRRLGSQAGAQAASAIQTPVSQQPIEPALAAVRRFVRHPIARMTGICSLIRHATPS
ncbi:hypothetical protein IVA80_10560 [Bradyrhizobium sp. 139]|uniref:hypothetical protein n=1 Tax=Bradyrhizobium sp. 139 TaxID=2782616 RepID=UPI001FF8CC4A|nr:hypothetical protein [Bradyrhizobium sp. 139]MCK1741294.1 hypothetical protein [Bradyrhizobium sp. 139]